MDSFTVRLVLGVLSSREAAASPVTRLGCLARVESRVASNAIFSLAGLRFAVHSLVLRAIQTPHTEQGLSQQGRGWAAWGGECRAARLLETRVSGKTLVFGRRIASIAFAGFGGRGS